jgi:hypothetical protein
MDFIGIILTFMSTALITLSRVIKDEHLNARNYLVYIGLLVSGAAVFVTYHNVQLQKDKLRLSNEENEKIREEVKGMKLKLFALNGQIEEATTSLLKNNDAASVAIAGRLRNTTGQLLSANYSTSSVVNDLLKEQNDSLKRILVKTVNILKTSISNSESNMKNQMKESENNFKQIVSSTETSLKIEINNLEDHVDDKFDETAKKLNNIADDSSSTD